MENSTPNTRKATLLALMAMAQSSPMAQLTRRNPTAPRRSAYTLTPKVGRREDPKTRIRRKIAARSNRINRLRVKHWKH